MKKKCRTAWTPTIFFTTIFLAGAIQNAFAESVTLACQAVSGYVGPPFVITLDLDNKTLTGDGYYLNEPKGPLPIQVTDQNIVWTVPDNNYNTLSRVTGSLIVIGQGTSTGMRLESSCHKSEKQF